MEGERELTAWLAQWAAASEQTEGELTAECLTSREIVAFIEDRLTEAARQRVLAHLSDCGCCTREVGSLYRASRTFADKQRLHRVLGRQAHRICACLRVTVDEVCGAFLRPDAVIAGLGGPVLFEPLLLPPGFSLVATRGAALDEDVAPAVDAFYEAALHAGPLRDVEVLCSQESDRGTMTVSLPERAEVRIIEPDSSWHAMEFERGDDRYYATTAGLPAGEYYLAFMAPA